MQYEVPMTVYMSRIANESKVPKCPPFKNLKVRLTKYLKCIDQGHVYISTPNMDFLCLTMWLVGLYTDNTDADTDNDDGQSTIV